MYGPIDPDEEFHYREEEMRLDREVADNWRDFNLINEIALRKAVKHPTDASYDRASKHYWQGTRGESSATVRGLIVLSSDVRRLT